MSDSNMSEKLSYIGVIMAIVLGLYLSILYSYLLFHSLIEIITIAVAFTLFILTWNTRKYLTNNYLKLLGIGFAFIALIDLLHTLAYKGMGVFPGYGSNLPTQLWIVARYLQAVTFVVAPLFLGRMVNNRTIIGIYAITVSALVVMVYSGNFPDCYIEGKGLTTFKISSEYVISAFLLVSLYLFYRKRQYFDNKVFYLIAASIGCTVLSEISFTAYVSVYGFANLVGHFSRLATFYLIYQAILVTGFKKPFDLIFRDLNQADESLRKSQDSLEEKVRERTAELRASEERYRSLIYKVQTAIVLHDGQGRILDSNPLAQKLLGLAADQLLGKSLIDPDWRFLNENGDILPVAEYPVSLVLSTQQPLRDYVTGIKRSGRDDVSWVLVNGEPEYNEAGAIERIIVSFIDITERKRTEEAIEKERKRMEVILSAQNTGLSLINPDMTIAWVNQKTREMFPGREPVGQKCHVFYESRETICDGCGTVRAFVDGKVCESEQLVPATGKWYYIISQPIKDTNGRVVNVLEGITDITERKLAEEALQKSEACLKEAQHLAHIGSWELNLQTHELTWSDEIYRIFGITPQSFGATYEAFLQAVHPDDREMVNRAYTDSVKNRVPYDLVHRLLMKNGNVRFVHEQCVTLYDEIGTPLRSHGTVQDITERKLAEKAMSLTIFSINKVADAVYWIGEDAKLINVNEAACKTLGYSREELLTMSVPDLDPCFPVMKWLAHWTDLKRQGSMNFETQHTTKDGRIIPVEVTANYMEYEGLGYNCAVVRNITERKRAEDELKRYQEHLEELVRARTAELEQANQRLKQLDRLKSMFIASMSHELRTPLNSIIGFTGMTLQGMSGKLNEEQNDNLSRVYKSAKHLLQMITEVIDISKIEAGKVGVWLETFELDKLMDEAVSNIQTQLKEKSLALEIMMPPKLELHTDRKRLLQCLLNLLSNAVKFTEQGRISVSVREINEDVELSVSDTGIGIAKSDLPKLFNAFERLVSHQKVKPGGAGLGLYLTKKITAEILRGSICVESVEGKGSAFRIRIPRMVKEGEVGNNENGAGN